jgi:hypothetical protein
LPDEMADCDCVLLLMRIDAQHRNRHEPRGRRARLRAILHHKEIGKGTGLGLSRRTLRSRRD